MSHWLLITLLGFLQCLAIGLILVPLARNNAARLGLIDHPNLHRKHHTSPIPRSGGLAIFPAFWGAIWINYYIAGSIVPDLAFLPDAIRVLAGNVSLKYAQLEGIFIGSFIIFILGLLDDRFNLPASIRLLVQILACLPLLLSGVYLKLFLPPLVAWPLTLFWIVLLTNSFNFLDNMNGLTSGVTVIICAVLALISLLAREWYMLLLFGMLAGAVLAFWCFNFPKASVFLGDSGSTHLGFLLASLTILCTYYQEGVPSRLPILIPLIAMGVPIFDTLSVLWIRWTHRKPLMQGDTNHLSHRLVALGMSRTEAVLFIYGATLVVGLAAIPLRLLDTPHGIVLALAISLIFLLLHWLERVSYRRNKSAQSP